MLSRKVLFLQMHSGSLPQLPIPPRRYWVAQSRCQETFSQFTMSLLESFWGVEHTAHSGRSAKPWAATLVARARETRAAEYFMVTIGLMDEVLEDIGYHEEMIAGI